jgi:RND family efflux transporter MFP subunit
MKVEEATMMHDRWLRTGALLGVVVLSVSCGRDEPVTEPEIRPVRTEIVTLTGSDRARTYSGTFRAGMESKLSFRVPGRVEQLPASVGQAVAPGSLLARLDSRDYDLQVQEAQASLTRALASKRNADAERDRVRELYENDNASLSQWDQARAVAESASAQVESLQKRLELAQLQLEYTRLTAPVAGGIATVEVEVNENVQAGQPIVTLSSSSVTEVAVDLPGTVITTIREGAEVVVECDALPGEKFDAFVTEVGVAASGATTFPVTVQLTRQSDRIRPGMAAEVTFRLASPHADADRVLVPAVAVGEDRGGRFVFLAEPTEQGRAVVKRRPVVVGDLTTDGEHDLIEVLEGLTQGDIIVTAGVRRLEDGRLVRLQRDTSRSR